MLEGTCAGRYVRWRVRVLEGTCAGRYAHWRPRTPAGTCAELRTPASMYADRYALWQVRMLTGTYAGKYVHRYVRRRVRVLAGTCAIRHVCRWVRMPASISLFSSPPISSLLPLSSLLFTVSTDKTGAVWDCSVGQRVKKLKGHTSFVNSCSPSRRGVQLLATGSDDGTIKVCVHIYTEL